MGWCRDGGRDTGIENSFITYLTGMPAVCPVPDSVGQRKLANPSWADFTTIPCQQISIHPQRGLNALPQWNHLGKRAQRPEDGEKFISSKNLIGSMCVCVGGVGILAHRFVLVINGH